ncbi:hypothetical protein C2E21_1877 [Chlorella sorokiniana]|uniref:Uncharacterized protein n=1 Tax=Chlorella sorokiniana TaxID=3076 RepID=A0A2P6TZY5_CHLSO|nr:hypothetical protein C2E21_1877 [Chlorella sorokiniana]|eukprot:PRW59618.1 hypothetical protein C2E21_1877 [Chlorella sorokiniana]
MASPADKPAAASPLLKLQLLADALAHDFSLSRASPQVAAALRRLLPGLGYLSVGVSNPVQGGMLVSAANCAAEGPTTLHLHDPHACAAGVALARGQPLQASLLNGAADAAAAAWSDVQLMLAQSPGVTHLLCIPFGPDSSSGEQGSAACQHHAGTPGSGAGALLFGFAAAPQLDERRKAVLALLARCLPGPMASLSGDTLAFVNFATGSTQQCSCCCSADEEEEEEEEGVPSERCTPPGRPNSRGDGGAAPSQALPVSRRSEDRAGPSCVHDDDVLREKLLAAAAAAAGSAQREESALLDEPKLSLQLSSPQLSGDDLSSGPPSPTSSLRFSKALVRAAEEQGGALTQQSALTLTFRSPLAEAEYGRWAASLYRKGDILFSLLLLSSLAIIAFVRPYRLVEYAPGILVLGLVAFLPMQLAWMHQRAYLTWREWLVAAFRLLSVAFINVVCMRSYQAHVSFDRLQQWVTFWRLTGAESLCVTAVGFRTRMHLHLSLQLAALAMAGWNLASVCNTCYPNVSPGACLKGAAAGAAGFGYLLPTAGLRELEEPSCGECETMEAPAALRPAEKLQLLADALALEFSQSLASTHCSQALRSLLPGLEYLSICVSNPAQGGAIVASANCATEGPTTLHLHDPHACAAGVALARGQPLQASLLNGAADTAAAAWSDVQLMLAQAPGVTHLLCIPFGPDSSSGEQGSAACQHHADSSGSGAGALLFGFAAAPQLDERRKAVLALLARCLPVPMASLSGDTLAFVNFATGSTQQCSCCCSADEDEEEEEEEEQQADVPCRQDRGSGGDGSTGPSQALRVPSTEVGPAGDEAVPPSGGAGPSSKAWWEEPTEGKGGAKAAAAVAAAAAQARADLHRRLSQDAALHEFRFSKPLLAAAEAEGEDIVQQSALTLSFRSALMESEFGRWVAQHHCKVDILFSFLMMAAFVVICFVRPYRLLDSSPSRWLAGFGIVAPAVAALLGKGTYATWRERFIIAIRIYVVTFVNMITIRAYESHLPLDRLQQWVTLFMLTGAESLAVTALGFPVRLPLHLPLQFAAMGLTCWNLPRMCFECFPKQDTGRCVKSSAAMAAMFGCLLPTVVLRYIEQRSRALFANQLRAAAAHQA